MDRGHRIVGAAFADRYEAAGRVLAGLHKVRFEHFYENILTIHHVPRVVARSSARLSQPRAGAGRAEPAEKLVAHLNAMDMSIVLQPGRPCLIHNDYSGANIVVDTGGCCM